MAEYRLWSGSTSHLSYIVSLLLCVLNLSTGIKINFAFLFQNRIYWSNSWTSWTQGLTTHSLYGRWLVSSQMACSPVVSSSSSCSRTEPSYLLGGNCGPAWRINGIGLNSVLFALSPSFLVHFRLILQRNSGFIHVVSFSKRRATIWTSLDLANMSIKSCSGWSQSSDSVCIVCFHLWLGGSATTTSAIWKQF